MLSMVIFRQYVERNSMPNSSSAAAPIVQLARLINEYFTPTAGPRDRLQTVRLHSQILRAADRSTFDALLSRAHQLDDQIPQSLVLALAGEQSLLLRCLLTFLMHDNATPAPQDAAIIKSLTTNYEFSRCGARGQRFTKAGTVAFF